jgi:hypothetical protein
MMQHFSTRKQARLAMLSGILLIVSACATTTSSQEMIEERAMARWEVLLSGDLPAAYEYLSPGFRSSVSSLQYQRSVLRRRVRWTNARYIESNCDETACKVQISLNYTLYGALPGVKSFEGTQTIEESWVLVNGTWYLVPEK